MSNDKKFARSTGHRSHDEIRAARGEKPIPGSEKITRRLQKRLDRLVKMGVVASGFLPKGVTGRSVTRRQLDVAEVKFKASLAKYDQF